MAAIGLAWRQWKGWFPKSAFALCLIIFLECLVLPFPGWYFAAVRALKMGHVDFREHTLLPHIAEGFLDKPKVSYLPVGDSQVEAVFRDFVQGKPQWEMFSLAGWPILENLLRQNQILEKCNGTVILFMSDFKMGFKSDLFLARTAPPLPLSKIGFYVRHLLFEEKQPFPNVLNFVFWNGANRSSAFRWRFVFQGFQKKYTAKLKAELEQTSKEEHAKNFQDNLRVQKEFLQNIDAHNFAANVLLLDLFCKNMARHNRKVVIVPGHYHPEVLIENAQKHQKSYDLLRQLSKKHQNVTFLDPETITFPSKEEYVDYWHVNSEGAKRFTKPLLALLQAH